MLAIKLKDTLSTASPANESDVLAMKNALQTVGAYDVPSYGLTPYTDEPLFEGMKNIQRKAGLVTDGIAKPGGPTELTLNAGLARKALSERAAARPTPRPSAAVLRLTSPVGRNQANARGDVTGLKNALSWTGHYPADKARRADPRHDGNLHWGLIDFQRAFNLRQDGYARPGGETETRINTLIEPLIQLASLDSNGAPARPAEERPAGDRNRPMGESIQVADTGRYGPSGWSNPTAWALEEAGRQAVGAAQDAPGVVEDMALDVLDVVEGGARFGADVGRAAGLDNAADNLDHFLDGSGDNKVYSREETRERNFIREAEAKNQKRFVEHLIVDESRDASTDIETQFNYRSDLLAMKDGETIRLTPDGLSNHEGAMEEWNTIRGTLGHLIRSEVDEALAFGTSQLKSSDNNGFVATRDGDTITVTGTVTHEWDDRYDFNSEYYAMNMLRDDGRAAEFERMASWQQEMTATLKIKNGELQIDSVDWRDIDMGAYP